MFACSFESCHRKFEKKEELDSHILRRHPEGKKQKGKESERDPIDAAMDENEDFLDAEIDEEGSWDLGKKLEEKTKEELQSELDELNVLKAHLSQMMDSAKEKMDSGPEFKMKEPEKKKERPKTTTEDILKSKKLLTREFILSTAMSGKFDEIVQLVLREKGLGVFDSSNDFSVKDLYNLEFLSLSHNKLTNMSGIPSIVSLVELNLNFNSISSLAGIGSLVSLKKLWISNNQIASLAPLKGMQIK